MLTPTRVLHPLIILQIRSSAQKSLSFYRNDDVYSSGVYEKFKTEADVKGLEIVSATTFTDASSNDFSVQLTEAKNAGADLLFLPIYYQPASLILKQAKDMGYEPTFFGVDGMDGIPDPGRF